MLKTLSEIIRIDENKCVNCHKCISVCPVKFCNDGSGSHIKLNSNLCIGCGQCLKHCSHNARQIVDDTEDFISDISRKVKIIAIVAPSVATVFPHEYLRLNGWLKSIGIPAVFDVSFGAELTIRSYLEHMKKKPRLVISQPCPAIVNYIELYRPELIPYLAPVDSPMVHTMKMIREFYPQYSDCKIAAFSPCIAKKIEFQDVSIGDYNVTFANLKNYFKKQNVWLNDFSETEFDNPLPERAVLFSTPGGLMKTAERWMPEINKVTRKLEGPEQIYNYLDNIPHMLSKNCNPSLVDCLNCYAGCNGGTGTDVYNKSIEELEYLVEERKKLMMEKYKKPSFFFFSNPVKKLENLINKYWKPGLYTRTYKNKSFNDKLKMPTLFEIKDIYTLMRKHSEADIYNCSSCGYGTCERMAIAIYNGLNRVENCHYYLTDQVEQQNTELIQEIEERKRAEELLRENESKFKAIYEGSGEAIMLLNKERYLDCNIQTLELFGIRTKEEFTKLRPSELSPLYQPDGRDSRSAILDYLNIAFEKGFCRFEWTCKRKNGESFPVEFLVSAFDYGGDVILQSTVRDMTLHKQGEQSIIENERRFKAIFDASIDAIMLLNKKGYIDCNKTALEMFGYENKEEILKLHPISLSPPYQAEERDSFSLASEYIDTAYSEGSIHFEWIHKRKNGEEFPAEVLLSGFDYGGEQVLLATVRDITERKLSEESLKESERKFKAIYEASNDAIIILIKEGFIDCNTTAFEMFGFEEKDDFLYSNFVAVSPDEQPDGKASALLADEYIETAYEKNTNRFEWMCRRKNGEEFPADILLSAFELGEQKFLQATIRDITERKMSEESLRESERKFKAIYDTSNDSIIILIKEGFIDCNATTLTMFGFETKDDVLYSNFSTISPEDQPDGKKSVILSEKYFQDAYETGSSRFEWKFIRKDGNNFPAEVLLSAFDLGEQRFLQATIRDITIRKKAEEALRRINDELEERVKEKTSELLKSNEDLYKEIDERKKTEEELREAKIAAEIANKAKSQFLSTMSHEIRTPMNAVIGMTSLLAGTPLNHEQSEFVDTIRTSSDTLLTLINDILDLSKIESGRLELEKQPFELIGCVEEAIDLVAMKASEKKLELAYTYDKNVPYGITGDVTRVRQILVNLLSNAVKFTEKGEVIVSIKARILEPNKFEIHYSVRDTGIGIPEDRINMLFKSFTQVDASTTRKYGGTGLGLVISKRLAEMMGGKMWIESELKRGSTFHFTIVAEPSASIPIRLPSDGKSRLEGKKVLIVDDNETNRIILIRQSENWGMLPFSVSSGQEAIELLKKQGKFDLAVLDMHMPEMDGVMLATEIRKIYNSEEMPLVMLTSLGERITGNVDFAAYLTKPIKSSQLYDALVKAACNEAVVVKKTKHSQSFTPKITEEQKQIKILLVEDNAINQKVVIRMLATMGYTADIAGNGIEAIESLKRQHYNVVLMDVHMPEMDGLEATRTIRRNVPEKEQPIIVALTAGAFSEDKQECMDAGMDHFLSKPVKMESLYEVLNLCAMSCHISVSSEILHSDTQEELNIGHLKSLLYMDDENDIIELVQDYLNDTPGTVELLKRDIFDDNSSGVRQKAHLLKSQTKIFGGNVLAEMLQELESMGKSGKLNGAKDRFHYLEEEYERFCINLQDISDTFYKNLTKN